MLYVFHVEPGTMLRFDMSLALESVEHLKQSIEQRSRIPVDKQVLLVSGGDSLDNSETICSYSAGTDTNPIYLFSKSVIESTTPPCASIDYGSDLDFNEKVAEMQALPASYNTVVQRTQLAIQFHEYAKEVTKKCERLVHDQHLQQQGWAAVVANLEDITVEFKRKTEICEKSFSDYLDEHENHLKFLQHFHDDLQILSKIPILSALLEAEDVKLPDDAIEGESDRKPEESGEITKSVSLLDWISSADSKSTMEQLFEHCKRGLEQFDNAVIQTLHTETRTALDVADKHNMKEVKGLGERLYGLESLMVEARRCVQQQADLAHSFQANQQRAGNLGDVSVLPDLCASHRNQLTVAQRNNQQLCDIRRRCVKAKEELSENLYHRLKWVMHVENLMVDANHKLVIYYENLKRLRQHLEVLQQIHLAPATYLTAVAEVVRRRAFSQAFLLWASELACHLLTIHNDEVTRRKDFHSVFQGHFLSSLFPGMEDLPPNFATQAPSVFDSSLPKLTAEDIAQLRQNLTDVGDEVPKLAELRETLETAVGTIGTTSAAINDFFLVKSRLKSQLDGDTDDGGCCPDDEEAEDKLVQVVTEATCFGKGSLVPAEGDSRVTVTGHHQAATLGQHLKDWDKGCESETDTEEFEKVCQSPLAALPPHSPLATDGATTTTGGIASRDQARDKQETADASTITEDNLETSHLENTRLKTLLSKMALLSQQAIIQLRRELTELKSLCLANRSTFETQVESLSSSWENLTLERDFKERENIQKLSSSHVLQLSAVQRQLAAQNEEIKTLKHENTCLESTMKDLQEETSRIKSEQIVNEARLNKELTVAREEIVNLELKHGKNVKELQDKLLHQHRADIDSLRSRFRLMSVETNSEETRKKYEADRENAILETILLESQKHAKLLDEQNKRAERLLADTIAQLAADKDKQIQVLVEREQKMRLECAKNKNSLQQLAEEGQTSRSELEAKVDRLEREKRMLTEDLEFERGKRSLDAGVEDLSGSVAPFDGKVDAATSPIKSSTREKLTRSQTSLIRSGKLSIDTCSVGDYVLVLWDEDHGNYIIVQTANYIFFLHSDCVPLLEEYKQQSTTPSTELQEDDDGVAMSSSGSKGKFYCVAEVVDKEYCHARRDCNRFNVPRGTKFYRVRVKLLPSTGRDLSRSLQQSSALLSNTSSTTVAPSNATMSQSTGSTRTVTAVVTSCPVTDDSGGGLTTTITADSTTTMCQSLPTGGVTSATLQQQQPQLEDTSGGGSFDELSTSTGENNSTNR